MYTNLKGEISVHKNELMNAYVNLIRKFKMEKEHWNFIRETLQKDVNNYDSITENELCTLITVLACKLYKS